MGRIKSFKKDKNGRLMSTGVGSKGYKLVILRDPNYRSKTFDVHRLIALTFIPNPHNYPQVNHINGIKTDNREDNLEWCTSSYNLKHAHKMHPNSNRGENNSQCKLKSNDVLEIYDMSWNGNLTGVEIGTLYGISWKHVNNIKHGRIWSHLTHHFDVVNINGYAQTELIDFSA